MSKEGSIKCSWCLKDSLTICRKLWFTNRLDKVTVERENFGEMLVECYDLDRKIWSEAKMKDAVICYSCICNLRIALKKKREVSGGPLRDRATEIRKYEQRKRRRKMPQSPAKDAVKAKKVKSEFLSGTEHPQNEDDDTLVIVVDKKDDSNTKHNIDTTLEEDDLLCTEEYLEDFNSSGVEFEELYPETEDVIQEQRLEERKPVVSHKEKRKQSIKEILKDDYEILGEPNEQDESDIDTKPTKKMNKETTRVSRTMRRNKDNKITKKSKTNENIKSEVTKVRKSKSNKKLTAIGMKNKMDLKLNKNSLEDSEYSEDTKGDIEITENVADFDNKVYFEIETKEDKYLKERPEKPIVRRKKEGGKGTKRRYTRIVPNWALFNELMDKVNNKQLKLKEAAIKMGCSYDVMQRMAKKHPNFIKKKKRTPDPTIPNQALFDELIEKLNNNQLKCKEAANIMGWSYEVMHRMAMKHPNFTPKKRTRNPTIPNRALFNQLIEKVNNKQLRLREAANKMGWSYEVMHRMAKKHPKYIKKRMRIPTIPNQALFDELIEKVNNNQLRLREAANIMGWSYVVMYRMAKKHPNFRKGSRTICKVAPSVLDELVDKINKNQLTVMSASLKAGVPYRSLQKLVCKHPKYIRSRDRWWMQWTHKQEQYKNTMELLKAVDSKQIQAKEAAAKLGISKERLTRLRVKFTGYTPTPRPIRKPKSEAEPKKCQFQIRQSDSEAIARIKAEYPEKELRSLLESLLQKKLIKEEVRQKLRCSSEVITKLLIEMFGSTGRGNNVPPKELLDDIKSIVTYTNVTPFKLGMGKTLICAYCYCLRGKDKAGFFDTPDELRIHSLTQHRAVRVVAVKHFAKLGQEILRVDITNLQCTVCSIHLPSWQDMFSHLETVHSVKLDAAKTGVIPFILDSPTKTKFTCGLCPKQFFGIVKINHHMNSHATTNKCLICGETFIYNKLLRVHECKVHNNPELYDASKQKRYTRPFCCELCGMVVKGSRALHYHMETHREKNVPRKKKFCCEFCGTSFTTHYKFSLHIRHVHEGVPKPMKEKCRICLDRFPTNWKKLQHMRSVHKMKVNYKCELCQLTFPVRNYLLKHMIKVHNHNQNTSASGPTEL